MPKRERNMKTKILICTIALLLPAAAAVSGGLSSARAVGMGEAYMGLAKGVTAPLYNPANVVLDGYRESGLELLGVGAEVSNNSFSIGDYNEYTGAILTTEDKADILEKIPDEGLKLNARVQASAISLSLGSIVISTQGYAASDLDLGKDVFDLLLNGNAIGDTVRLDGTYGDAISYATAGLTIGKTIYRSGNKQLALGVTGKYVRGIGITQVLELDGEASTQITGFAGSGAVLARTALGGSGYAVDLGAALKLSQTYTAGISFTNLFNSITWNHETEEHLFRYEMDTITIDNMEDDSVVVSEDSTYAIENFKTELPAVMRLGIADASGKLRWAIDWEQGLKLGAGVSTKPRLMTGLEWRLIGFMPLRFGYGMGGGRASTVSFGSGLNFGFFYLDGAVTNHGTISSESSKGLHLAVSTGFKF